jgi:hypothetical protein
VKEARIFKPVILIQNMLEIVNWFLHKLNALHFYKDCHILYPLEGKGKCFVAPFYEPFFWVQILFL